MLSLLMEEDDAVLYDEAKKFVLTEAEAVRRTAQQKLLRETPLREPDPDINPLIAAEIARREKVASTYHFDCPCGCPISTRAVAGRCPSCSTAFDLSGWGK